MAQKLREAVGYFATWLAAVADFVKNASKHVFEAVRAAVLEELKQNTALATAPFVTLSAITDNRRIAAVLMAVAQAVVQGRLLNKKEPYPVPANVVSMLYKLDFETFAALLSSVIPKDEAEFYIEQMKAVGVPELMNELSHKRMQLAMKTAKDEKAISTMQRTLLPLVPGTKYAGAILKPANLEKLEALIGRLPAFKKALGNDIVLRRSTATRIWSLYSAKAINIETEEVEDEEKYMNEMHSLAANDLYAPVNTEELPSTVKEIAKAAGAKAFKSTHTSAIKLVRGDNAVILPPLDGRNIAGTDLWLHNELKVEVDKKNRMRLYVVNNLAKIKKEYVAHLKDPRPANRTRSFYKEFAQFVFRHMDAPMNVPADKWHKMLVEDVVAIERDATVTYKVKKKRVTRKLKQLLTEEIAAPLAMALDMHTASSPHNTLGRVVIKRGIDRRRISETMHELVIPKDESKILPSLLRILTNPGGLVGDPIRQVRSNLWRAMNLKGIVPAKPIKIKLADGTIVQEFVWNTIVVARVDATAFQKLARRADETDAVIDGDGFIATPLLTKLVRRKTFKAESGIMDKGINVATTKHQLYALVKGQVIPIHAAMPVQSVKRRNMAGIVLEMARLDAFFNQLPWQFTEKELSDPETFVKTYEALEYLTNVPILDAHGNHIATASSIGLAKLFVDSEHYHSRWVSSVVPEDTIITKGFPVINAQSLQALTAKHPELVEEMIERATKSPARNAAKMWLALIHAMQQLLDKLDKYPDNASVRFRPINVSLAAVYDARYRNVKPIIETIEKFNAVRYKVTVGNDTSEIVLPLFPAPILFERNGVVTMNEVASDIAMFERQTHTVAKAKQRLTQAIKKAHRTLHATLTSPIPGSFVGRHATAREIGGVKVPARAFRQMINDPLAKELYPELEQLSNAGTDEINDFLSKNVVKVLVIRHPVLFHPTVTRLIGVAKHDALYVDKRIANAIAGDDDGDYVFFTLISRDHPEDDLDNLYTTKQLMRVLENIGDTDTTTTEIAVDKPAKNEAVLEVWSKAPTELGRALSPFNLKLDMAFLMKHDSFFKHFDSPDFAVTAPVETFYQTAKVVADDRTIMTPKAAVNNGTTPAQLKKMAGKHGAPKGFKLARRNFKLEDSQLIYAYLYVNALLQQPTKLLKELGKYDRFVDPVFNPKRSVNCHAHVLEWFKANIKNIWSKSQVIDGKRFIAFADLVDLLYHTKLDWLSPTFRAYAMQRMVVQYRADKSNK